MKAAAKIFAAIFIFLFVSAPVVYAADGDPVLLPGSSSITTLGTIATGTWGATDVGVEHGGTGASTLTDGGILLGSGTAAVTAMNVLGDGVIVIGDNSTDPTVLAAFTSSTGVLKLEYGGLEVDTSGWTTSIPLISGSSPATALTFDTDDNLAADSDTAIASQSAVKSYVDNAVSTSGGEWGAITDELDPSSGAVTTGGYLYLGISDDVEQTVTSFDGNSVGDVLIVKADATNTSTVTITDGANLNLQANFLLDSVYDTITLLCITEGTPDTFIEIARANNATGF